MLLPVLLLLFQTTVPGVLSGPDPKQMETAPDLGYLADRDPEGDPDRRRHALPRPQTEGKDASGGEARARGRSLPAGQGEDAEGGHGQAREGRREGAARRGPGPGWVPRPGKTDLVSAALARPHRLLTSIRS